MRTAAHVLLVLAVCAAARAASTQKRVLVTGFLPFNQYPINPSGDVSRQLNGTCSEHQSDTVCFDGLVLPVNETGSSLVSRMIEGSGSGHPFVYDAVIHMGLEDVAKGLKLETFAINQAVPDNATFSAGVAATCLNNSHYDQPTAPPAVAGAPCELPTTADLGRLALEEALLATGLSSARRRAFILEAWSRNAGTYYCNETLFRTLEAIRRLKLSTRSGRLLPAIFVHLPDYDALPQLDMVKLIQALGLQLALMQ